jgi:hypothetical protein
MTYLLKQYIPLIAYLPGKRRASIRGVLALHHSTIKLILLVKRIKVYYPGSSVQLICRLEALTVAHVI